MCRIYFYSRPCGRGDGQQILKVYEAKAISTHAPAGGATAPVPVRSPAGGYFYSRPCGRGDSIVLRFDLKDQISTHAPAGGATVGFTTIVHNRKISTHAPAGGATMIGRSCAKCRASFLLTPLREGRLVPHVPGHDIRNFYSRPCGRGDPLHPLRRNRCIHHFYSRPCGRGDPAIRRSAIGISSISTHAPAGGATKYSARSRSARFRFLLTPLREGRRMIPELIEKYGLFLLTPLREGRPIDYNDFFRDKTFLLTPLREGRQKLVRLVRSCVSISTHAPAGGATRAGRSSGLSG